MNIWSMLFKKFGFYVTFFRLMVFCVLAFTILAIMFPVRLAFCGQGGRPDDAAISNGQFFAILGANLLTTPIVVRLKYGILFFVGGIVCIVLVNVLVATLFIIPLR